MPRYVTGHITQATISTAVFHSYNPWNSCIPWYSSTGFPEQRTLLRITRCFGDLFFYLPAFYLLLLCLGPSTFKNPYCAGFKPVSDWKQYRHLQPRHSSNNWKYCPGTDSSRAAYFKDLRDLLDFWSWKKQIRIPGELVGKQKNLPNFLFPFRRPGEWYGYLPQ